MPTIRRPALGAMLASFAVTLCAIVHISAGASAGTPAEAQMAVNGQIVAIDRHRHLFVLEHGPLETIGSGRRTCSLRHRADLSHLKRGVFITAMADTSRTPWILDRVREIKPAR